MDTVSVAFNLMAVAASFAALVISSWIAMRQNRYVRDANHLPIAVQLLQELRRPSFIASVDYVERQLAKEHDPETGILRLPSPAREHVINVAYYYQTIAALVVFDVAETEKIILTMGRRILRTWDALAPFVYAERRQSPPGVASFRFFEDLAVRCAEGAYDEGVRRLRLRRFDQP